MQTGLERFIAEGLPEVDGRRVGLITNPTGVDGRLHSAVDLLWRSDRVRLVALFGPEHGILGTAQAGEKTASSLDQRTGLPVHSLYGATLRPTAAMLDGLDALIFDMQDVGARYATYLGTLAYAQQAAAEVGLPMVIFDRPNPITGAQVEGNILDRAFASFVGVHPISARHGLTVGELARMFADERGWPQPIVARMHGWERGQWFDETGLPWVQPSPNLPTLDSVTLYPGACLIEGTNLSEGRGTTRPFELVGAPWLDAFALVEALERRELPGVTFRPVTFTPTFSKHAGSACHGAQAHITNRDALRPVSLGLHLVDAMRQLAPDRFAWLQGADGRFFIDLLLGSDTPRRALDHGIAVEQVIQQWDADARAFAERSQPYLLYGATPMGNGSGDAW